mmetsp:Transcript_19829/g.24452  ORF Transcript_19829/g.24452 Transcript_19829/m.24452 type:complete len:599 (+) Transcript_19829:154-1950(+)
MKIFTSLISATAILSSQTVLAADDVSNSPSLDEGETNYSVKNDDTSSPSTHPDEYLVRVAPSTLIIPQETVCFNNDCDANYGETTTEIYASDIVVEDDAFVLPASIQDNHEQCQEWASRGECNYNPRVMLRECIPSCLSDMNTEDNTLLAWGSIREPNEDDNSCEDWHTIAVEEGTVVRDDDEGCEDWADMGLCKSIDDKDFMLERCSRACMVCIRPEDDEFDIGAPQEVVDEELLYETLDIMVETWSYMSKTVMDTSNPLFHTTRRDCRNLDPHCAHFAAMGECDPDSEEYPWMVLNCAPVCRTCELIDFSIRCPIPDDAVEALAPKGGDSGLHAMFERIVGERDLTQEQIDAGMNDFNYVSKIISKPMSTNDNVTQTIIADSNQATDVIDGPWVITLENLITDEECDRLIELGHDQGFKQSTEQSTNRDGSHTGHRVSKRRTSTNAFCRGCERDKLAKRVQEKIAVITGFPPEFSEDLQLLKYHPGQYYKSHHDYIPSHKYGPSGPRVLTVLLYLNDVEEGGATRFNELAEGAPPVDVYPKRGSVLIWPSVLDSDVLEVDDRTYHEAMSVDKGMKYAANAWLHLRDEKNVYGIACD